MIEMPADIFGPEVPPDVRLWINKWCNAENTRARLKTELELTVAAIERLQETADRIKIVLKDIETSR